MVQSRFDYECTVVCNEETVYPAMAELVKKEGMSVKAAARSIEEDSGGQVTAKRAEHVYFARTPAPSGADAKPPKKQTKPEAKIHLEKAAKIIKAAEASDDDIKGVGDAIAEAILEGKAAPRVGTRVETAVKKQQQKGRGVTRSKPNFERLEKHTLAVAEGLTFWADGTMMPETKEEAEYARSIRQKLPTIIVYSAKLGIDVKRVIETFYEGKGPKKIIKLPVKKMILPQNNV